MVDYSPLHAGDPFPATWQGVKSYGNELNATATLIADSVRLLRRCADEDNWETDTADAFRERAGELAGEIDKSRERYEQVGAKLVTLSDTLDAAEDDARRYAVQAREHEAAAGRTEAEPGTDPDGAAVPLTPAEETANSQRQTAIDEIDRLQGLFDNKVDAARSAADDAATAIRGYLDDDVKDSWWDRNAGWLKVATQILGVIVAIAAIVMLTVATGGTIWIVAALVAAAAGLLSLGINIGLAQSGNGSWWSVAFDAVSLLTLGTGGLITRALSKAVPALRSGYSSFRGMQAFSSTFSGWRLTVGNALSRAPLGFLRNVGGGMISRLADDAFEAANVARTAALQSPAVSRLSAFVMGGRQNASDFAHARTMLDDLRGLTNLPAQLGPDAARLLDDATRVTNHFTNLRNVTNIGAVSGVGQLAHDLTQGGVPGIGNGVQVVTDLIGRLR